MCVQFDDIQPFTLSLCTYVDQCAIRINIFSTTLQIVIYWSQSTIVLSSFVVISEGRDNFSVYIDLFKSATKKIEETYVTLQEKPLIQYHPVITGRKPYYLL